MDYFPYLCISMNQHLAYISLLFDDYGKIVMLFTNKFQFILTEEAILSETYRWVSIKPAGQNNWCPHND